MKKTGRKLLSCVLAGLIVSMVTTSVFAGASTLQAYYLQASDKASLNLTSGQPNALWATWAAKGNDSIAMSPTPQYTYPGRGDAGSPAVWTGPDDANMTVKAAVDETGIYVHLDVEDNVFVPPAGADVGKDDCEIYFDAMSSTQIAAAPSSDLVNAAYGWAITTTSQQFQVLMGGGTSLPTYFILGYFSPITYSWPFGYEVQFTDLPTKFPGMQIELYDIDATHKGSDWFLPWSQLGGPSGIPTGTALANAQFAFTCGYDDEDDPAATAQKCLRWLQYDPFASSVGTTTVPAGSNFASWGDIVMPATIGPVATTAVGYHAKGQSFVNKIVRTELYDLRGEKIPSGMRIANNSIVVEKCFLADGKNYSHQIRYKN